MLIANRTQEQEARAYCQSIGADPDEVVAGMTGDAKSGRPWVKLPRWRWYLGVSEAGLRRPI